MRYVIEGDNLPVLKMQLETGEAVECESGAMSWMDDEIQMQTKAGGLGKMLGRMLTNENAFMNTYYANRAGEIAFSSKFPGSIRAVEINADCILAAKSIGGVYDKDPGKDPTAKRFDRLTFKQIVDMQLQVIDLAASVLCMENKMPMRLFSLYEDNSIINALNDDFNGTVITTD